jgi:hypothetical protein
MDRLDVANASGPVLSPKSPRRPSAVVPDFLHRGSDGYVPLARKVGAEWQELGSVPAGQLRGLFADEVMAAAVQADSYFGLHAMYRAGRYKTKHTLPGLQPSLRNVDSVRWLTCCGVDLDAYNIGLDVHGAQAAVMRLVDEGVIPPPSVFTMSRGLWVLWRLHDKLHTGEPLRAYPDSVMARWAKVQMALHTLCSKIGSDTATRHAATVTRIPGSVNSKNGRRVGYMIPADTAGQPFSYTLDELESYLRPQLHDHVVVDASALPAPRSQNPTYSRRALKGWHGRWHNLKRRLAQLHDIRGGWKVGTRSSALLYVALTLRALRAEQKEVRRVMAQHLVGMEQPAGDRLTLSDALRIFASMKPPRRGGPHNQTLADALNVTPDEAALLSADRKKLFPPAAKYVTTAVLHEPAKLTRDEATARRREAVKRICDAITAAGLTPDGPDVQAQLLSVGLTAARATVLADMKYVGCPSGRTHRSRPAAASAQAQLF